MRERVPAGADWRRTTIGMPPDAAVVARSAYVSGPVSVVSTLVNAELPDGAGVGPQWHVSISRFGARRPKPHEVRRALRAFGMERSEEDNHHPGNARHFWLPVDPAHRVDCECKLDEQTVVEADGYKWQNPREPVDCRGCEQQRMMGRPCPLHGVSADAAPARRTP